MGILTVSSYTYPGFFSQVKSDKRPLLSTLVFHFPIPVAVQYTYVKIQGLFIEWPNLWFLIDLNAHQT